MSRKIIDVFTEHTKGLTDVVFGHWMPRMVVAGCDMNDVTRLRARLTGWESWPGLWEALGDSHAERAGQQESEGNLVSAGASWRQASLAYHYGHFMLFDRLELRHRLLQKSMEAMDRALPHLRHPGKRVYLPVEGHPELKVPCLQFDHPAADGRMVMLTGGADADKEEMTSFAEVFLDRGLSVLIVDGPGQGETTYFAPYRRATHKLFGDTCVAYMNSLGYHKLAVGGISMGGHFCPRYAAVSDGFSAAFGVGGPYEMISNIDQMGAQFYGDFGLVMGAETMEELYELIRAECDLSDVIANLTCPLMIIHGDADRIVDYKQSRLIVDNSSAAEKNLIVIPDGNHVCNNYVYLYRPVVADWLVQKLK